MMNIVKISGALLAITLYLSACTKDKQTEAYSVEEDVVLKDVSYGDHEQQRMDVYLPAGRNRNDTKMFVFIHGGGWTGGDKGDLQFTDDSFQALKAQFPAFAFVNLNYRLVAGEDNRYPAAENDVKQAMNYLYRQLESYQLSSNTYLAGGSAGAHLAALHTLKNNENDHIKGCIAIAGVYDMVSLYEQGGPEARQIVAGFMGGTPADQADRYAQASPVNFITPSSAKFLLMHGMEDALVPVSQAYEFRDALAAHGVDYTEFTYSGGHGIPPEHLVEAFEHIAAFLR
ncbi:prolyl oligopeptidase family serine peptidase [Parapedobacter sp. 10938]|uniref:prolyl oligopeptidase family serine peptidase n=1 Tax=Parapedobacter flavus TaxID=3110225 RepID=UPI002DBDF6C5|nr:prolyl oligopeptidase family serine peptidase [Parapedobacter sp. 10938]MEC3879634.1 prolyl oligopeptidase family serine peptidase [Parapedobacter sp. 10938]